MGTYFVLSFGTLLAVVSFIDLVRILIRTEFQNHLTLRDQNTSFRLEQENLKVTIEVALDM